MSNFLKLWYFDDFYLIFLKIFLNFLRNVRLVNNFTNLYYKSRILSSFEKNF